MPAARAYIQNHRAALFDWLVILTSFSLGFIFPTLGDFIQSPGYYYWMLASLILYIAGAALKHVPLGYRLSRLPKAVEPVPYLVFLVVGHWFIIFILVILSGPAIRQLLGLPPLTQKDPVGGGVIFAGIAIACLVTWLVYRTKSKPRKKKEYSPGYLFRMELVADILLIAGVSVIAFVFWEKGAMAMLGRASAQTIGDIWFLFVFLAILFLFFYLPLRYLFFMEDRARSGNRRRLFLIFSLLLIRALLEMLGASVIGKANIGV